MTDGTNEQTITADELYTMLRQEQPNNSDKSEGYALVNVLSPEHFEEKHIPESINIPKGSEKQFEQRFDKEKHIIVYCASPSCNASPEVAAHLREQGFKHVTDFEGGVQEWEERGFGIEGGSETSEHQEERHAAANV